MSSAVHGNMLWIAYFLGTVSRTTDMLVLHGGSKTYCFCQAFCIQTPVTVDNNGSFLNSHLLDAKELVLSSGYEYLLTVAEIGT
ncbi:hypothetical protein BB560_004776, partial [Smittium megazygosporum]